MMMTVWFALIASMILFVALPTPQRRLVSVFALQRNRWTAFATIPALLFGATLAFLAALLPVTALAVFAPDTMGAVAMIGLTLFFVHVLWSLKDRRNRLPIADNDNLPERRIHRIFVHMLRHSLYGLRYILALAGLMSQFVDQTLTIAAAEQMLAIFLACTAFAGLFAALFPRLGLKRIRRPASLPASGKPRTVYIARRAVTAGFRRIAA